VQEWSDFIEIPSLLEAKAANSSPVKNSCDPDGWRCSRTYPTATRWVSPTRIGTLMSRQQNKAESLNCEIRCLRSRLS